MHARVIFVFVILGFASHSLVAGEDDSEVFNNLTSHEWRRSEGPFGFGYSSRESLRLRRNGEYIWEKTSDYTERADKGLWNLETGKEGRGLLRLSKSTEAPFRIEKDRLLLGILAFERGEKTAYDAKERKSGSADMKPVKSSESFQKLTRAVWVKTSPFDDHRLPQRIEFDPGCRFSAAYRDGACQVTGNWQLLVQRNYTDLFSMNEKNDCGYSNLTVGDRLAFADDLLLLRATYAPQDKLPKRNIFFFDRYGNSVRTRGEFEGKFTNGRPIHLGLTHESMDWKGFTLISLDIEMQKCEIIKGVPMPLGKMQPLVHKNLDGISIGEKTPHRHEVEFTPPSQGDAIFQIQLQYKNASQRFDAPQAYIVHVHEK
jgi:hypothetical protein